MNNNTESHVDIEKLPTGHMVAFDSTNGRRYLLVAPTEGVPHWEVYRFGGNRMPQVRGIEAQFVLDDYFEQEEA